MADRNRVKVTQRNQGFTRDLGWKTGKSGKRVQPRFLLGHDRRKAERASLLLEQLWAEVVEQAKTEGREPVWDERTLTMADAIRKGKAFEVGDDDWRHERTGEPFIVESQYAQHIERLRQQHPGLHITPADPNAYAQGQQQLADIARHLAAITADTSRAANRPMPAITGQTLHAAMDAYADYATETRRGGEREPKDAVGLKVAINDMTLDQLGYDAIESMGTYWHSRPVSGRHGAKGKPIAIDTVNNRLKTSRRFFRWLHLSDAWQWRAPDGWEQALRFDRRRAETQDERLATAEGPETWTIEELTTLYEYATDGERLLILGGLNLGFAQSEWVSFRHADIKLDDDLPHIKRVRNKTAKLFKVALWNETVKAIEWLNKERARWEPKGNPWVLLTESGQRPGRSYIANRWQKLLRRVQADHPGFHSLGFKFLRKTAYQLVLEASGSMEVAGAFQARAQLSTDEQADRYGRRLFDRVFTANLKVRERLQPMFNVAPDAFTTTRRKGNPNLSRGKIKKIQQLHGERVKPAEIARVVGCSRQTVYRWAGRAAGD